MLALAGGGVLALAVVVWLVLRYPKRMIYRGSAVALGAAWISLGVVSWQSAIRPANPAWSIAGAISAIALLGSVALAMTLGHWYLVVRGMAIDPLKRLTIATLIFSIAKVLVVAASLAYAARDGTGYGSQFYAIAVELGIFFWMRIGWGLAGPLFLYPMVWGTVKIRSTMAATGILYVDVVAVVIGEVLGGWLSSTQHLPL
ncbi:MAG TPA: hypothetical protein VEZ11_18735 [Thermoanaerobaculia bacterium]|nr:hypothetical protein [Thermoanaerobaculia bacterium]